MAANTPGTLLNMYEVCCVLCAAKLKESTSRINVRGRSEFPIEEELRKLPIAVLIDDKSRICKLCLKKLRKQKSLRDSLQESAEAIVRTFTQASESDSGSLPSTFVPLHTCTPKKSIKAATPNNSSLPVTGKELLFGVAAWSTFRRLRARARKIRNRQNRRSPVSW